VFAAFAVVPGQVFFPRVGLALLRFGLCVRWVSGCSLLLDGLSVHARRGYWLSLLSGFAKVFGLGVFAAFAVVLSLVLFPRVGFALLWFGLCDRWVSG
jgi:hypothetical protein